jgi:hypothetical protein
LTYEDLAYYLKQTSTSVQDIDNDCELDEYPDQLFIKFSLVGDIETDTSLYVDDIEDDDGDVIDEQAVEFQCNIDLYVDQEKFELFGLIEQTIAKMISENKDLYIQRVVAMRCNDHEKGELSERKVCRALYLFSGWSESDIEIDYNRISKIVTETGTRSGDFYFHDGVKP